ncbi:hypothetical protein ElyMa_000383600 [Elysia marginata]|uniref:Uncharacterized protein n=1 Tax=Elysia marginata TaxID=1093978 RepID=A0AAV4FI14_9GAST|nr:hypothetical protein ElyMa_000383600 [Elysia marginata]
MQWENGGVIKVPLRHLYLAALVLLSAYFLAREISWFSRKRRHDRCDSLATQTRGGHPSPLTRTDLNPDKDSDCWTDTGRRFQTSGPWKVKALSP